MARLISLLVAWCSISIGPFAVAESQVILNRLENEKPLSVGIALFPGFEPLDVFGPLEILYAVSMKRPINLSFIAKEKGLVSCRPPFFQEQNFDTVLNPQVQATHSFAKAPQLDVLMVPGGRGTMALEAANDTSVEDFVRSRFGQVQHLMSVCTGAVTLAKAGVLDGLQATTNKMAWSWAVAHGKNVTWVPSARWVNQGKIWTSSGVSAGIDMMYAFLQSFYGPNDQVLKDAMNEIEYAPHTNGDWDPFSVVHKVPGANMEADLKDCVTPVGY